MRYRNLGVGVCALLLATGMAAILVAQDDPPEWVYFSNEEQILRVDPSSPCIDDPGCVEEVLYTAGANFEGLNFGPDQLLYFCDSQNGRAGRIDTSDLSFPVEIFYDVNQVAGPVQPQCGWFTHLLDFIASDKNSAAIYAFGGLGGDPFVVGTHLVAPTPITVTGLGAGGLDGLTQYIDGTLLVARPGAKKVKGEVVSVEFPGFLPSMGNSSSASTFVGNLKGANGVAVSNGYVFVSSDAGVTGYAGNGDDKDVTCSFAKKLDPTHLAATVNDRLYVGLKGKNAGEVVEIIPTYNAAGILDGCGSPTPIARVKVADGFSKMVGGVAVTPTAVTVDDPVAVGENPAGSGRYEYRYEFNGSNIWELSAGASCDATIEAVLTHPADVQNAIENIEYDENGQGISNPLPAKPVTFFGDNGYSWIYSLSGLLTCSDDCADTDPNTCCAWDPGTCDPPVGDEFYRHLLFGYAPFLPNVRIGVCEDALDPADCAFMELTIAVSTNQDLTTEDPVGGRRRTGSDYYWVDQSTDTQTNPGVWCGFESPVNNTRVSEEDAWEVDPFPSEFDRGDNIPIKGRLAEVTEYDNGDPIYNCQNGPFIKEMGDEDYPLGPLLSVARVDADGNLVEIIKQLFPNGSGQQEPAYFDSLGNATGQWHYNLDSDNLVEGWYEIWVAFPLDNTAMVVTDIYINDPFN